MAYRKSPLQGQIHRQKTKTKRKKSVKVSNLIYPADGYACTIALELESENINTQNKQYRMTERKNYWPFAIRIFIGSN